MKKLKVFLIALLALPCVLFSGCSLLDTEAYVTGIEKTSTIGNSDVYTISYSDGTTSKFTVENGEDGEDVQIEAIFNACVARGMYTDDNDGFKAFLADYMSIEINDTTETQAINKAMMSAVEVYSQFNVTPSWNGASSYALGCGAGVIYKMENDYSYIITNYHVVYDDECTNSDGISTDISIYQYGADVSISKNTNGSYALAGDSISCIYIGGALKYDIAVLKVSTADLLAVNAEARAVDIADSYTVGETAIAIGNPEGAGISVTKGIVSVYSEEVPLSISTYAGEIYYRVMRVDMAINGGNSGGGIYNDKGELIGILNSKSVYTSEGDPVEGMAYALPYDNITKVADNVIYYHEDGDVSTSGVIKMILGINYSIENNRVIYNTLDGSISLKNELKITAITSNLAKDFEIGDIVTALSINGEKYSIDRAYQLADYLLMVREGDDIIVTVTRDSVPNLDITIENVPVTNFSVVS